MCIRTMTQCEAVFITINFRGLNSFSVRKFCFPKFDSVRQRLSNPEFNVGF
jgi:hypothetical protein